MVAHLEGHHIKDKKKMDNTKKGEVKAIELLACFKENKTFKEDFQGIKLIEISPLFMIVVMFRMYQMLSLLNSSFLFCLFPLCPGSVPLYNKVY